LAIPDYWTAIGRSLTDPAFSHSFQEEPERALLDAGYDLDVDELADALSYQMAEGPPPPVQSLTEDFWTVLGRSLTDPPFNDRLRQDPEATMRTEGYMLGPGELAEALSYGTSDDLPPGAELLAFFRSSDTEKDPDEFERRLADHYWDDHLQAWHADWQGFYFPWEMDFSNASFVGPSSFSGVTFARAVRFHGATFCRPTDFLDVTFLGEADFEGSRFGQDAAFSRSTFSELAQFSNVRFAGAAMFVGTKFSGPTAFVNTTFRRGAEFKDAVFFNRTIFAKASTGKEGLTLGATVESSGLLELINLHAEWRRGEVPGLPGFFPRKVSGPPTIRFDYMSLSRVRLVSMDGRNLRFLRAVDIDQATFEGIRWPRKDEREEERILLADEADLREVPERRRTQTALAVERIYRAIRKNYEDRTDRVAAHDWYFSEMEVGRNYAPRLLTRLARHFYKGTSNYGLSAMRPAVVLVIAVAAAFLLFSVPSAQVCPVFESSGTAAAQCVGWTDRLEVVLLAIFLQAPPNGVSLSGPSSVLIWLLLRVTGAAMLVSIAVAFRNQVAR
jgi:uncharacterized protein YjbI with pentapeptide repeats